MSKIGNYIHAHYVNYQQYGITKESKQKAWLVKDFKNQHDEIIKRIAPNANSLLTKNEKEQLRKSIYAISNTTDNSQDNSQQIRNFILKELEQQFSSTLGSIDFGKMNVSAQNINKAKSKVTTKANKDLQYIQLSVLLRRIENIQKMMSSIESQTTKKEINSRINQIYHQLKDITGILIGDLRKNNLQAGQKIIRIGEDYAKNKEVVISINETLNQLIKDYLATPAINLQKGDLFEYAIALAPAVGLKLGEKELNKTLKEYAKTKVGGDRSQVQIKTGNFDESISRALANASIPGYRINKDTNTILSYGVSQDKIDVSLSWGGKTIPISAKNINLKSAYDIHILSGSSLLYLLQDENPILINHYLNITASHADKEADSGLFQAAHEAIKIAILVKALSGKTVGRQAANTFIVNDNSKTGLDSIQIYDIIDLVNKAKVNIDSYTSITANKQDLSKIHYKNDLINNQRLSEDDATNRIANLLLNLHQYKVTASLKKNIL